MIIGLMFIGAVILIGIFLLVFVIGGYNALVTLRNRYKNAYAQIDVQLKRRYDLIPNLVETAKAIFNMGEERSKPSSQRGMPLSRPILAPRKIRATLLP